MSADKKNTNMFETDMFTADAAAAVESKEAVIKSLTEEETSSTPATKTVREGSGKRSEAKVKKGAVAEEATTLILRLPEGTKRAIRARAGALNERSMTSYLLKLVEKDLDENIL